MEKALYKFQLLLLLLYTIVEYHTTGPSDTNLLWLFLMPTLNFLQPKIKVCLNLCFWNLKLIEAKFAMAFPKVEIGPIQISI